MIHWGGFWFIAGLISLLRPASHWSGCFQKLFGGSCYWLSPLEIKTDARSQLLGTAELVRLRQKMKEVSAAPSHGEVWRRAEKRRWLRRKLIPLTETPLCEWLWSCDHTNKRKENVAHGNERTAFLNFLCFFLKSVPCCCALSSLSGCLLVWNVCCITRNSSPPLYIVHVSLSCCTSPREWKKI